MSTVRIGSARIDENGKVSGGQPGDQTGKEVAIEPWYLHAKGWVLLRAKDATIRERIAQCMEAACANDNIGYNQDKSWEVYDLSKPYGWDCGKISKPCSSDCSNLIRTCVAYAAQKAIPWFSTLNEVTVLSGTGLFDVITDDKYTKYADYLLRGDILCTKTQGHTVGVLDNGSKAGQTVSKPTQNGTQGSSQGNTALCGTGIGTATAKQKMNIRNVASSVSPSSVIASIDSGTAVEVLEITASGWYKIVWPGAKCGYAYTKSGSSYYTYIEKVHVSEIKVGDIVQFTGDTHYISSLAPTGKSCKPGKAKVTVIAKDAKHPYHIIAVSGGGSDVYGWVDADKIKK